MAVLDSDGSAAYLFGEERFVNDTAFTSRMPGESAAVPHGSNAEDELKELLKTDIGDNASFLRQGHSFLAEIGDGTVTFGPSERIAGLELERDADEPADKREEHFVSMNEVFTRDGKSVSELERSVFGEGEHIMERDKDEKEGPDHA